MRWRLHAWPVLLGGIAAACAAALLAWPPARSVAREHLLALTGRTTSVSAGPGAPGPNMGRAVPPVVIPPDTGSSDYLVQLGATMSPNPHLSLTRLGVLAGRHPGRSGVRAHLLWQAAHTGFRLGRPEMDVLAGPGAPRGAAPATPASLEPFRRTAERGERLDPGNAYFALMLAAAHFAANEDARAFAALERAAGGRRWDDGEMERRQARLRTAESVYGRLSTMQRLTWDERGGQLAPSLIGETAAVATVLAARAEARGDNALGWRIRRSLIRCGGLIRRDACSLPVALQGAAMAWTAMDDPFAAASDRRQAPRRPSEAIARAADRCVTRLNRSGRAGEAPWVQAEAADAARLFEVQASAFRDRGPGAGMPARLLREPVLRYAWPWLAGLLALANAAWLLAFGVAVAILRPGTGRPWGLALAGLSLGALLALGVTRSVRASLVTRSAVVATRPDDWLQPLPANRQLAAAAAAAAALPLVASVGLLLRPMGRSGAGPARPRMGWAAAGVAALALYTGLAVTTAARERDLARALEQLVAHEAAYLAASVDLPPASGPP